MAIYKPWMSPNGIPLSYHRIAMVSIDVNQRCSILIHSYVEEENRQYEKDYADGLIENPTFPFVYDQYIECDYDEDMCLAKAYTYIKTLPEFEGAIDV